MPAERHRTPLANVAMKLELLQGQDSNSLDESLFLLDRQNIRLVTKSLRWSLVFLAHSSPKAFARVLKI
jgi:hypothetical protein